MLTYFSVTCGILTIARMIGVPFSLMLVFSQTMLSSVLGLLIGGGSAVISIVLIIVTYVINVLIYFVYQRIVCAKIYEKWAGERLRVQNLLCAWFLLKRQVLLVLLYCQECF